MRMLKHIHRRIHRKLSSRSGETIGEVLAATVVVSLGAILLATMVSSSRNIITRSGEAYKDYMDRRNEFEKSGTLSEPDDVQVETDENKMITKVQIKFGTSPEGEANG